MRIFICSSKHNYHKIPPVEKALRDYGHIITLPNSYEEPFKEEELKKLGKEEHMKWKANMIRMQEEKIRANESILVLNLDKNGQKNYIGGSTFLEMFKAWELNRGIYLYNPIPESILTDEIMGFNPIIINGDLTKIR